MNRQLICLLLLAVIGATPAWALSVEDTRHLLDRTGFGARPEMIAAYAPLARWAAVERVLMAEAGSPPLPDWALDRPFPDQKPLADLPELLRLDIRRAQNGLVSQRRRGLKDWWYQWMLSTDAPLVERMTLFWHNHFTSQIRIVGSPQLMLRQHQLLRQHALGNYADLLRAIVTDPAMLIYLDGRRNQKARPNENFARELLELFTLGEGHYSEADIQSAARALSGWALDPVSGTARLNLSHHDDGEKTFLGQTGHWGADSIVAILLQQPRTAEWLVEKLWIEFISPDPDPAEVKRLAVIFRDSGYEMRPLLRALLNSNAFWAQPNRGTLIKSPIELVIGTLWRFDLTAPPMPKLVALTRGMGQDPFDPPDVKGWPGQTDWINTDRLLARDRYLRAVTRDLADETAKAGLAWASLDPDTATRLLCPIADTPTHSATTPQPTDPAPSDPVQSNAAQTPETAIMDESGIRIELIDAILDPRYQLK